MSKIKYVLLMSSTVLIGLGVYRGEAGIVLKKAIRICLECIGVG